MSFESYEVFIIDLKGKLFISSFETTPLSLSKSIVSLNIIEKFFWEGD